MDLLRTCFKWSQVFHFFSFMTFSCYAYTFWLVIRPMLLMCLRSIKSSRKINLERKLKLWDWSWRRILRETWWKWSNQWPFANYLNECEIVATLTMPGTLERNDVAERETITIMDMVRTLMSTCYLLESLWGEALEKVVSIFNRVANKSIPKTPFESWTDRRSSCNYSQV